MQAIRNAPRLQQQQQMQQPGGDDDVDDCIVPVYAELAPSTRRTEHSRIVDNSTAVYAAIVHPQRTQQS